MAIFNKKFETKHSAFEMKIFINTKLLTNQAVASFIDSSSWDDYVLNIISKFGTGKIILTDNLIEIIFDLNFIGSLAKNTLETTLDKEFKQLQV